MMTSLTTSKPSDKKKQLILLLTLLLEKKVKEVGSQDVSWHWYKYKKVELQGAADSTTMNLGGNLRASRNQWTRTMLTLHQVNIWTTPYQKQTMTLNMMKGNRIVSRI